MPPNPDLDDAIAALQPFRPRLGDAAVDAAIAALRRHAAGPAAADAGAGPRLRQVSVLFADVAGSTALLGQVGPEDAADLLGRALQGFADAVQQWGGRVLRFTGDGIKAAFGADGLHEDEAERAVRAGLQILQDAQAHAHRVQQDLGVAGFGVRVGIHTGDVLLGGGVEAERSAIGHAVHLAARMEQSAPVGALRISDDTWQQVRGLFQVQAQPPLQVKGHDAPLTTWLVTGLAAAPDGQARRGLDGLDTPMLGRADELQRLLGLPATARASGGLAAALVLGDAGIGKTRLRLALLQRLGLAEGQPGLLQARAQPGTRLQPHGLLRQLLARWLGLHDDLPPAAARQRLLQGMAPWLGPQAALQAPRIGQLVGLDFSDDPAVQMLAPAALREQAHAALRAALAALCAQAPQLLVLDDLHWADDDSLDWLQGLLARPVGPLAVLLLARPALAERGITWQPAEGVVWQTLPLQPLPPDTGGALLDALLAPLAGDGLPAGLRADLLDRAAGNPFFLEALVRMLIDDGVIDTRSRPWRLQPERQARLRVPATLVGVLQASLDALPPAERQALQQASIVGPVFWSDALAALDAPALAALPALLRRRLVEPRGSSAFAGTDEHAFGHQLLHETTYATVLKADRRAGHARAAQWLAVRLQEAGGAFAAITADHWERAGDSARALDCWDLAADDANRRGANAAALDFIDRALAQPALQDAAWRAVLLINRRQILDRTGQAAAADAALQALADHAEAVDSDAVRAHVAAARMLQADHAGRRDAALAQADQALALATASGQPLAHAAAALAEGERAWLAVTRDDFDATARHVAAGMVHARAAAQVPRRLGGNTQVQHALQAIGIEALVLGERHAEALQAARALLADLRARGAMAQAVLGALTREAMALRCLGRNDEAWASANACLALARDAGLARLERTCLVQLGELAMRLGRLDEADALITAHDALAARLDGGANLPEGLELRASWHWQRGDAATAQAVMQRAAAGFAAVDHRHPMLQVQADCAALALAVGQPGEARTLIDDLLARLADDPRPHRRQLVPVALLRCHTVLSALADARAASVLDDLRARLEAQLAQLSDDDQRRQLLQGEPGWRGAAALLGIAPGQDKRPHRVGA